MGMGEFSYVCTVLLVLLFLSVHDFFFYYFDLYSFNRLIGVRESLILRYSE